MAVAWPAVRAALVTIARDALPAEVKPYVYDGPVVTGQAPRHFLCIADQPSASGPAGTFDQSIGPDGFTVTETGSVAAELAGVTGTATVPDVFGLFDLIASAVQADQTLGGALGPASTVTASAAVAPSQTTAGAVQRLLITFDYFTRL